MPAGPLPTLGTRGRSTSISQQGYVDEHGEPFADDHLTTPGTPEGNLASGAAPPHSGGKGPRRDRDRIQTFECEICSKKYRHSTCLIKHRWVSPLAKAVERSRAFGFALHADPSFFPISPDAD